MADARQLSPLDGGVGPASAGVARNATTSYALRGFAALSALALTPYLYRTLGEGGFGTWSVLVALTTTFDLLEVGFASGAAKLIAEARGRGDRAEVAEVAGVTTLLMGGMGVIALAVATIIAFTASGLAAAGEQDAFRDAMLILGAAAMLRLMCGGAGATLMGYQRWDLWNAAQGLKVGGYVLGAVIVLELGGGIFELALAFAVPLALGGVAQLVLLHRIDPSLPLRPHPGRAGALRRVSSFNAFVLLADSMVFIGQRLDTVFIAGIAGAPAAAPYAAAVRLQSGVQSLTLPFLNLLLPMVSELDARKETGEVLRRLVLATRVSLQLTLPVALGFALFAPDIVDVWLGADPDGVAVPIIVALMAGQVVSLTAYASEKVLVGIGRVRTVGKLAVAEGVANVTVSITLIALIGALGAALGTLAVTIVFAPLRFPLACRALGVATLPEARRALLPAIGASLPGAVVMVIILLTLDRGALRLLLGVGAGVLVSVLVALGQAGPERVLADVRRRLGTRDTVTAR